MNVYYTHDLIQLLKCHQDIIPKAAKIYGGTFFLIYFYILYLYPILILFTISKETQQNYVGQLHIRHEALWAMSHMLQRLLPPAAQLLFVSSHTGEITGR